jgi:hypothetical protein
VVRWRYQHPKIIHRANALRIPSTFWRAKLHSGFVNHSSDVRLDGLPATKEGRMTVKWANQRPAPTTDWQIRWQLPLHSRLGPIKHFGNVSLSLVFVQQLKFSPQKFEWILWLCAVRRGRARIRLTLKVGGNQNRSQVEMFQMKEKDLSQNRFFIRCSQYSVKGNC